MPAWMQHNADFPEFREIGPGDTVVDVGCGHQGGACVSAGLLGAEVIGIDIAPELLSQVEEIMRGVPARSFRAILSDCDPIPLPDSTADLVVCTEVLEHVEAPDRLLAELVRIGKPGARYILSVPDEVSESLMRLAVHPSYFKSPGHLRVFGWEEFDGLIASAGLKVERRAHHPHNFYWGFHCLLRAALDPNGLAPGTPALEHPALEDWNRVWQAIQQSPKAEPVIAALDRLLPRSQAVIARKPGATLRFDRASSLLSRRRWRLLGSRARRAIRGGAVSIGRTELRWSVSRGSRPRPTS
jgi:SAM-dependent methyltransferase